MNLQRGEIWWADLGEPRGSEPAFRRPVLVIQNDQFNQSRLATVIVLGLTSNLKYADMPGNILLTAIDSGLEKDSVINVTQVTTIDKTWLESRIGKIPDLILHQVEYGLGIVLGF